MIHATDRIGSTKFAEKNAVTGRLSLESKLKYLSALQHEDLLNENEQRPVLKYNTCIASLNYRIGSGISNTKRLPSPSSGGHHTGDVSNSKFQFPRSFDKFSPSNDSLKNLIVPSPLSSSGIGESPKSPGSFEYTFYSPRYTYSPKFVGSPRHPMFSNNGQTEKPNSISPKASARTLSPSGVLKPTNEKFSRRSQTPTSFSIHNNSKSFEEFSPRNLSSQDMRVGNGDMMARFSKPSVFGPNSVPNSATTMSTLDSMLQDIAITNSAPRVKALITPANAIPKKQVRLTSIAKSREERNAKVALTDISTGDFLTGNLPPKHVNSIPNMNSRTISDDVLAVRNCSLPKTSTKSYRVMSAKKVKTPPHNQVMKLNSGTDLPTPSAKKAQYAGKFSGDHALASSQAAGSVPKSKNFLRFEASLHPCNNKETKESPSTESASLFEEALGEDDIEFSQELEKEFNDNTSCCQDFEELDLDGIDSEEDCGSHCLDDGYSEMAESESSACTSALQTPKMSKVVFGELERAEDCVITKPAVIESIFSNCPPVLNFGTKFEKVEQLPSEIRKLLRWKMSPITPIVVRTTVARSGFRPSRKSHDWLGYFGKHMKSTCFKSLREYQKINHFPGSFQLGRKDRLWRNLSRMQAKFGKKEYGFVPQSFILPWDKKLLKTAWEEGGSKQKYILKPPASARGIGIRIINKWNQIPSKKSVLVQKYLSKPYLLNGCKFDLRLYVYVSSFDPLRIYLFDDGLVRFATCKYSSSMKHLSNRYMHLTNYSINKKSGNFQQNDDVNICQGHKWSLKALWKYLQEIGEDTDKIWEQMKDIVIKTLISVEQFTNSLVKANCRRRSCCHEVFGFDIMLDERLKPWILEVNISPSLHSNSPLDVSIKGQMVSDMLNLAGFPLPNKKIINASSPSPNGSTSSMFTGKSFSQEKRRQSQEISYDTRSKHTYFAQHNKQMTESELMSMMLDVLTVNDVQMLVESESENCRRGHFERIFPGGRGTSKYLQFFEQPRYYNFLLHLWEIRYQHQREKGNALLESHCRRGMHVPSTNPIHAVPSEHTWIGQNHFRAFKHVRSDSKVPSTVHSSPSVSSLPSKNSFSHRISSGCISSSIPPKALENKEE